MSIDKDKTIEIVKNFGSNENDSGSADVQVAILSERIKNLTEHLKKNRKDFNTERSLVMMVGKRKSLLSYLKDIDINRYREIIKKLKLRK